MEYSSSSTYSQKTLHSIYYSSIPPLPIPKNRQKECSLSGLNSDYKEYFPGIVSIQTTDECFETVFGFDLTLDQIYGSSKSEQFFKT